MKSINEISRNLNANIQTRQITNAMYLLSASQIRRMADSISYIQSYMKRIRLTVKDILLRSESLDRAFSRRGNEAQTSAFIVVSSDKSLCGAFNINVADLAAKKIREVKNPVVFTAGKHGDSILRSRGIIPRERLDISSTNLSLSAASRLADDMIERFVKKEFDEVFFVFTRYRDQLHQEVVCIRLFPVIPEDFTDESRTDETERADRDCTIFEPDMSEVFEAVINEYVAGVIYSGFIQSAMSEHIARMNAMQSATRNADEMIASLRLQYNSARQLAITNEISEIFGASELLERGV